MSGRRQGALAAPPGLRGVEIALVAESPARTAPAGPSFGVGAAPPLTQVEGQLDMGAEPSPVVDLTVPIAPVAPVSLIWD